MTNSSTGRRLRRTAASVLVAAGLLVTGAASCEVDGPGVPASGEQGDTDGSGDGGVRGEEDDPGEGGAGDEIGGGS